MDFKNKIILATLAGVNNIAFRKLCTAHGADIVYSQMIDCRAMARGNNRLADFYDEKNVIAQFFGNEPESIGKCIPLIKDKVQGVDLNLGCPHSNVVERQCGSYLMRFPAKISKVVKEMVKHGVPVFVKMRAGFDKSHINAVKIAKLCEKEGAAAIAVHGRPRTVNYEAPVDYSIIKKVKDSVDVPVIGNGDIFCGKDAKRMYDETGCDSVMIGRGAMGDPCIFDEIKAYLGGEKFDKPGKVELISEYIKYCSKYEIKFEGIKSHAQWMTKGMPGGARLRNMLNGVKDVDELIKAFATTCQEYPECKVL